MIVEIDLLSLGLTVLLFTVFILIGAAVERSAHFFWPVDFISVMFYITGLTFVAVLTMLGEVIPWELAGVSLAAYLVGYVVSSRRKHINLFKVNARVRQITVPYVMPYKNGDQWFLQFQSTKEHAKRVLFGVTSKLTTNWDLKDQWAIEFDDPIFPTIKMKTIITEIYNDKEHCAFEIVKKGPFTLKKYTPEIFVSPQGMSNCLELISAFDAHYKDIITNLNLTAELMAEKHQSETKNHKNTTDLLMRMFDSEPTVQLEQVIAEAETKKKAEEQKAIPEHMKRGWFGRRKADV